MGRVSGKVVIITGAASGMGLAAAELFCKEGAIVLAGVNRSPIPEAYTFRNIYTSVSI